MEVAALVGFRQRPSWIVAVVVLLAAQGYLTLQMFHGSIHQILNDEPIISGIHPLHLYHGSLGVQRWLSAGTTCAYDPAFQAGYPKTPIFADGARPAELFLLFSRGQYSPHVYKIGLALFCLFAPLGFLLMARGIGLSPATACLSALLGIALWWSTPVRDLLLLGDLDLLLGGFSVGLYLTWMIRFDRWPSVLAWVMLTLTGCLGWYTQPLLWAGFIPFATLFYLWVGAKQGIGWHLSLVAATTIGVVVNLVWLHEFARYWWIVGQDLREWPTLCVPMPEWPEVVALYQDQPVNAAVISAGLLGLATCIYRRHHGASVMLGMCIVGLLFIVRLGRVWEPLAAMGSPKLLALAGWFAVCPAASLLNQIVKWLSIGWQRHRVIVGAIGLMGTAGILAALGPLDEHLSNRPQYEPFEIGLSESQQLLVDTVRQTTNGDARILWEERCPQSCSSRWTALLPQLTGRAFLGGLDPQAQLEHMYAKLGEGLLAGRPIHYWTNAELTRFVERYNVGWIVCWSPEFIERFRRFPHAREAMPMTTSQPGVLFTLVRKPSFILKGQAEWVEADWQRISLANVVPDNGEVVLSLHYQHGMRISPSYVQMERDLDAFDPIPMMRLKMPGEVARLTLTWDHP